MKKMMTAVGVIFLAGSLLAACNSDEGTDTREETTDEGTSNELVDEGENEEDNETDSEASGGGMSSDQDFNDQLDLGIGDTAQISSNQGAYEITIHSVKREEEVDGETSMFDYIIVVDLTVKNIGDEVLDAYNPIGVLDQTARLEGSGSGDFSKDFPSIDAISGDLEPGEEIKGQALFATKQNGEQFIRIKPGLIAADGVYNEVVWTFTEEEME
ncbi:hypothetical protein [Alkalihalobacillus sp. 1P02AB]|uniref:hypothetical protein n=1 Tax=Alkalihalobacillus sp. 1P02AB TaxID=3132260 RepID=UPI0039A4F545